MRARYFSGLGKAYSYIEKIEAYCFGTIPQNQEIPFEMEGEECNISVPEVTAHQMVVLSY